ncbi:MAG: glycosyltransferase [Thermoanaerobaculia bacterium]|nr:glycosyltransferase [Thermoanaerobaculia bacterium]
MKILWVATKAPWPPVDGGRLLLWNTLAALRQAGDEVTLVAPYLQQPDRLTSCETQLRTVCRPELVPSRLRSSGLDLALSMATRRPWTLVRHRNVKVLRRVSAELADVEYDVVVAEQVQALSQIPQSSEGPPVVLRAQNVESDLWQALAAAPGGSAAVRWGLRHQSRCLAHFEGRAVLRSAVTAALTEHDATALRVLAENRAHVEVVPATVEEDLPAGRELDGDPALVLFGSSGWKPNAEGARLFLRRAWTEILRRHPGAVLHLFGDLSTESVAGSDHGSSIRSHPSPDDSRTALAENSILVVPLTVASGVRMKILEAWARGVAVVASPAAARGLVVDDGELVVAETSDGWPEAIDDCIASYDDLVARARRRLQETYSPAASRRAWHSLFESAICR